MLTVREKRSLAQHPSTQGRAREFLVFRLAGELYGLELARIHEILSTPPLTLVPRAPQQVMGICSVRGMLVTVIDLRFRLNLERRPATRLSRVLLSQTVRGEVIGLFVDEVRNVVRLTAQEIELAQTIPGGDLADYVLGVGRPDGEPIVLLDQKSLTE
jgi:purine-binding chemotaxis protein CheW